MTQNLYNVLYTKVYGSNIDCKKKRLIMCAKCNSFVPSSTPRSVHNTECCAPAHIPITRPYNSSDRLLTRRGSCWWLLVVALVCTTTSIYVY